MSGTVDAPEGDAGSARHRRVLRGTFSHLALLAISVLAASSATAATFDNATATVSPALVDVPGTIRAAFSARSYRPGDLARLRVVGESRPYVLEVLHMGVEATRVRRDDRLAGTRVLPPMRVFPHGSARGQATRISLRIGSWPSGFYFVRLSRSNGDLGYAPFVIRPRRLGSSRVLVVLPTYTWQAYNFRDVDGDGVGDTWYASADVHVVDLARPYLRRGVPPHFRAYDRAFIGWIARTRRRVDYVADDDLERVSHGDDLSKLYDLIVFPGHEEYVSLHAYDVVRRFCDLGGNLAFLSADTFWYRVERHGDLLHGREPWRDLGRPPSLLTGSSYVGWWERRYRNRPYVVTGLKRAPWLFAGTGLRNGDSFGRFGIEADATNELSPPHTMVVARIRDIFGPGTSAEMTYYETPAGAKVFSAGALNFGGSLDWHPMSDLMENLWRRLSVP
jgi:hypothetical protein